MAHDARRTAAYYDALASGYARRWPEGSERLDALLALVPPGGRILDLGCGAGIDLGRMVQSGRRAVGLDVSAGMARAARDMAPRAATIVGDTRAAPFRDGSFDGAIATFSLIHLAKRETGAALAGVARLLRPGAPFLATVQEGEPWEGDLHGRHMNVMSRDELTSLLERNGLPVVDGWSRAPRPHELPYRKLTLLARSRP